MISTRSVKEWSFKGEHKTAQGSSVGVGGRNESTDGEAPGGAWIGVVRDGELVEVRVGTTAVGERRGGLRVTASVAGRTTADRLASGEQAERNASTMTAPNQPLEESLIFNRGMKATWKPNLSGLYRRSSGTNDRSGGDLHGPEIREKGAGKGC
jgi:hypothetical protein